MAATAERVLGQRALNRALLARQHLLARARSPLPRVLEQIGGIQAQYAPSMYIGLWSRVDGFERDRLTRALERRTVVQGTLMRATIHLVSARDYWLFLAGIAEHRRRWWQSVHPDGPALREMTVGARRLRKRLAHRPLRQQELDGLLGKAVSRGVGMFLPLVRVPPSGTWERRRADLYAAAEDWLGGADATREDGGAFLIRRYLRGFGPAAPKEIANWAGLPVSAIAPSLERVSLRRFRSETGEELVDLPRAPLPDPDTPAPVRFLPTWDATLLVHARRTGLLPEEYRSRIFSTKTPHSLGTFLVDGSVAGTWRYDGERVVTEPFERLDAGTRRELGEEAERLAYFHR